MSFTEQSPGKRKNQRIGEDAEALVRTSFGRLETDPDESLEAIWHAVGGHLYNYALWLCGSVQDSEDIVQEVFCDLATKVKPGTVLDPLAYLLTMVRYRAYRVSRQRQRLVALEPFEALLEEPSTCERLVDGATATMTLRHLSAPQREVVLLRFFFGLTFRRIGELTSTPTFTSASRYRLAIMKLRKLLGKRGT